MLPFLTFIFITKIVSRLGNYTYEESDEAREKSVSSLIFDDYFASTVEDDFLLVEIEA